MFSNPFKKKSGVYRGSTIVIKKEQMAKLSTIAEAYQLNTNEAVSYLIDGFFSNPHTDVGKHVQQVMATGNQGTVMNSNPLLQIYQQLPPELQKMILEKVVGGVTGTKEALPTGF